ncbi:MAG: hypothetical protein II954_05050 [Synergistaceae bacterium]|nr:hypothetical protein [Synergistaceae bacterium]
MRDFYGKTYRYNYRTIGVCNTLTDGVYMIAYPTTGGHKRMKGLPLFGSKEEAQKALDEFARAKMLPEVRG